MESIIVATPKIDWESGDLPGAWKKFKAHRIHVQWTVKREIRGGEM